MAPTRVGVVASIAYAAIGVTWALLSGAGWVYAVLVVAVAVVGVFIPGEANQVTLARAYLVMPAVYYASTGMFGAMAVVVALAGLTDLVDGTVARRYGSPTNFGGGLDPVVDGLFMGALGLGLALRGLFPIWLAAVVLARYFVPAIAGAILLAAGKRLELRHTLAGQVSTTLNLVLLGGIALLHGLDQDPGNLVIGAEIVIPIAALATFVQLALAARRRPAAAGSSAA